MVDFSVIMVGDGAYVIGLSAFGRSYVLGVLAFRGYCDRRHAHGAVKAPAHIPNLAVLALSSSAL